MKKILCLVLTVVLMASFSGCSLLKTVKNINAGSSSGASSIADSQSSSDVSSVADIVSSDAGSVSSATDETSSSSADVASVSTENGVQVLTFYGLKMQIPDGFEITDTTASNPMITSKEYPVVADNINFVKMNADNISIYSKELFEDAYKEQFDGLEFKSYEVVKLAGFDTIRMNYSLSVSDIAMEQIQYMIFADDASYIVTLTLCSDTYTSVFENCVAGIKISAI